MHYSSIAPDLMADIWCAISTHNKRHEPRDGTHAMHARNAYLGDITIIEEADSLGSRYHLLSENPLSAFEADDDMKVAA